MSIFETFYLLFKADSSQLKKEVDDVKKKTGELTDVSKKSEDQTKKTDNEFKSLAGTLGKVAAGYFGIGTVINGFKTSLANVANVGNLSRTFGFDPEKLDAYRKVVKSFGFDVEAATSGLLEFAHARNLQPNDSLTYLAAYGEKLREKFPTVAQAQGYGRATGVSPELISVAYNIGNLDKLVAEQEKLGAVNAEDIALQQDLKKATEGLLAAFDGLIREINTYLLPAISGVVSVLTPLVQALEYIVNIIFEDFFGGIGEFIGQGVYEGTEFFKNKGLNGLFNGKEKSLFNTPKSTVDFSEDLGGAYRRALEKEELKEQMRQSFYVPTSIPSVSNSQASSFAFTGDVHINTTAQDTREIASNIVGELGNQSKALLAQLQQSNANFDNGVVI